MTIELREGIGQMDAKGNPVLGEPEA